MGVTDFITDAGRKLRFTYRQLRGDGVPDDVAEWGVDEVLEGGLANSVWTTEDGAVAKQMDPLPSNALMVLAGNLAYGSGGYPGHDDRIAAEESFAGLAGTHIASPTHEETVGNVVKMEEMDGVPFKEWAAEMPPEDVYRGAYRFGSDVRRSHNAGYRLTDGRLGNLLMDEETPAAPDKPAYLPQDAAQAWVDREFATADGTDGDRELDLTTIVSSARHLSPDTYAAFLDGFEHGYGEAVQDVVHARANITSKLHPRYLEQEPDWERHAHENAQDLAVFPYDRLETVVDAVIASDAEYGISATLRGYDDPLADPDAADL